jgi:hypothetical protein
VRGSRGSGGARISRAHKGTKGNPVSFIWQALAWDRYRLERKGILEEQFAAPPVSNPLLAANCPSKIPFLSKRYPSHARACRME